MCISLHFFSFFESHRSFDSHYLWEQGSAGGCHVPPLVSKDVGRNLRREGSDLSRHTYYTSQRYRFSETRLKQIGQDSYASTGNKGKIWWGKFCNLSTFDIRTVTPIAQTYKEFLITGRPICKSRAHPDDPGHLQNCRIGSFERLASLGTQIM